jgi:mono/diheme cytochrome c family protein
MSRRRAIRVALALGVVPLALAGWVAWQDVSPPRAASPIAAAPLDAAARQARIEHGARLARAGNCQACHTARGGEPYAGGREIHTPFGVVVAGNLTPHASGLGGWTADDFHHALHHGRGRDGRRLNPAFPYTAFTLVTREDSDALFAFLQSLPPVARDNAPHRLRWPFGEPWALALWRALHFEPGVYRPDPTRGEAWNRGAYLVRGLGHCASCHAPRNVLGGTLAGPELGGGTLPGQPWHAPALGGAAESADLVPLLKTGQSARGSVLGPMAEVVLHGTQHLPESDLAAMATYLASQPAPPPSGHTQATATDTAVADASALGERLYRAHCMACHGEHGDGQGLYPPLAGNRSVALASPLNVIQAIRRGGFAPATAANPRPFGMPPFGHLLSDAEIAAVASHVRQRFADAAPVRELDVLRAR